MYIEKARLRVLKNKKRILIPLKATYGIISLNKMY